MKLVNDRISAAITEDLIHSKTNFLKNFAKVSSPYFVLDTITLGTSLDLNDKTWGTGWQIPSLEELIGAKLFKPRMSNRDWRISSKCYIDRSQVREWGR